MAIEKIIIKTATSTMNHFSQTYRIIEIIKSFDFRIAWSALLC